MSANRRELRKTMRIIVVSSFSLLVVLLSTISNEAEGRSIGAAERSKQDTAVGKHKKEPLVTHELSVTMGTMGDGKRSLNTNAGEGPKRKHKGKARDGARRKLKKEDGGEEARRNMKKEHGGEAANRKMHKGKGGEDGNRRMHKGKGGEDGNRRMRKGKGGEEANRNLKGRSGLGGNRKMKGKGGEAANRKMHKGRGGEEGNRKMHKGKGGEEANRNMKKAANQAQHKRKVREVKFYCSWLPILPECKNTQPGPISQLTPKSHSQSLKKRPQKRSLKSEPKAKPKGKEKSNARSKRKSAPKHKKN